MDGLQNMNEHEDNHNIRLYVTVKERQVYWMKHHSTKHNTIKQIKMMKSIISEVECSTRIMTERVINADADAEAQSLVASSILLYDESRPSSNSSSYKQNYGNNVNDNVYQKDNIGFSKDRNYSQDRFAACRACLCWVSVVLWVTALLITTVFYFHDNFSSGFVGVGGNRKHNYNSGQGYGFKPTGPPRFSGYPDNGAKVAQIALLGERNSGTNWMTSLLASCFPDVPVTTYLKTVSSWLYCN